MDITIHTFLIVCPLVFLAGLIDSIAGGGGLISLPAYFIAGLPPHYAIATNKMSSSVGTAIATFRYCKNKLVDWGIGIPSVILALMGSTLGANLALLVNEKYLKYILLIILPVVGFHVLKNNSFADKVKEKPLPRKKVCTIAFIAAFVIGAYDGFYGPGTGTFLILIYTGLARMDIRIASGNTKLVNLASNIAALITFILNGKIIFLLGLTAALFSIAGNYIGSGLVLKNGYKIVKPIILVVISLLFIKIISG
ncbi:sulfite exporter TauE/SafE family protein [Anaerocolumna sp. MB42-C2]|uniref:sulfite exporter TauE/SafE family protein n=1 Tax=Anaerocolumna sp. MB42-C2 TaxID=3070997 RepID=UPI0027E071EF|nr:TSUP family transporter [Anaerocolumna sp. MB42-C2]WMJ90476.1 TSUP family transporter [Anaerocolumna sp. MB42-C2]